jgi:hypothetical protein
MGLGTTVTKKNEGKPKQKPEKTFSVKPCLVPFCAEFVLAGTN